MANQATTRPGSEAEQKARDARDHPLLMKMARLGFFMYGVVYITIAILALQLAFGDSAGKASGEGAMHELAQKPWGSVGMVVAAVALAALCVWEVCQAIGGHTDRDGLKRLGSRLGSAGRAVVFAGLAVIAAEIVLGQSSGGGTDGYTARLMRQPFGPWLVGAVGLVIVAIGVNSVHKALSDRWRRELEHDARTGDIGTVVTVLARTGYGARGLAFFLIGGLFVWAGVTHDPDESAGLDQALRELRDAPYGPWLLAGIAVGLGAYGLFNVAKAWAVGES
jgi:hypothetical protein